MRRPVFLLFLFLMLFLPALGEDGSLKCTFKDLPSPPKTRQVDAGGINDAGAIVGTIQKLAFVGTLSGFLLFHDQIVPFTVPNSFNTNATAINNRGEIVGFFLTPASLTQASVEHGFLLESGKFHTIDVPGAITTQPLSINDRGDIVGQATIESLHGFLHGFLLRHGHFKIIMVPGAFGTIAAGINNRGEIVGTYVKLIASNISEDHGFLLKNGVFTTIDFPGATNTQLGGINDAGDIVGSYNGGHGFSLIRGTFTTVDVPNRIETALNSINNRRQVIATSLNINFGTRVSVGTCQVEEKK